MSNEAPQIVVDFDYDGFFEGLVRRWVSMKEASAKVPMEFKHTKIVITSGPYRQAAVSYVSKDGTLFLDFYSAMRAGFGSLSAEETAQLIEML